MKSWNNPILIKMLVKSTLSCFKDLLWWRCDWDYRKLTHTTENEEIIFGFIKWEEVDLTTHIGVENVH